MPGIGISIIFALATAAIYFATAPSFTDYECRHGITFKEYWQHETPKIAIRAAVVFSLWTISTMPILGFPQDALLALAATVAFEDFAFCGCHARRIVIPGLIFITTICFIVFIANW